MLTTAELEEIRVRYTPGRIATSALRDLRRLLSHISGLEEEIARLRKRLGDEMNNRDTARAEIAKRCGLEALDEFLTPREDDNVARGIHGIPITESQHRPANVAGMFHPPGEHEHPLGPSEHERLKASMPPDVYDKKMEDARQLMRDFRRPGR